MVSAVRIPRNMNRHEVEQKLEKLLPYLVATLLVLVAVSLSMTLSNFHRLHSDRKNQTTAIIIIIINQVKLELRRYIFDLLLVCRRR